MNSPVLEVHDLAVAAGRKHPVEIVHGIDLTLRAGETVGVVGESGSGKSVTMLALMRLLGEPLHISRGHVRFRGQDLAALREPEMRSLRGREIAMVYQDPMTSLNPFMRVGDQVTEALLVHGVDEGKATARCLELFARVGIPDPARTVRAYPHEFSGGMRQRVVIAMALALRPALLIADEPTTALDVTIQQQILGLVAELQQEMGMATIWVTHDLGVVARLVERVVVMYGGHVVEDAPVAQLFAAPQHPYTERLLASLPNPTGERAPLAQIPGRPPLPSEHVEGCAFRPRCPQARDVCAMPPPLVDRAAGRAACWVPPHEWSA
ncbi:ABC transporter ATP-binding protein [Pseudonocardia sp. TRM90224]|uniref:ABC transporter ATP-binding protein n=1 Tax=Pseudonocardia sp. TRM90224 TaxID=2812678 RepID=UPI001E3500BA|nr:ABC transporter ATP-binding protein [Pseudonocardia sp. TRM90224]